MNNTPTDGRRNHLSAAVRRATTREQYAALVTLHGWTLMRTHANWLAHDSDALLWFDIKRRVVVPGIFNQEALQVALRAQPEGYRNWDATVAPYWVLRYLLNRIHEEGRTL
jgi:hypothetical protein